MERNTESNSRIGNQIFDVEQFSARGGQFTDAGRLGSPNKKVSWVRSHTPKPMSRKVADLEEAGMENQRALSPRQRAE